MSEEKPKTGGAGPLSHLLTSARVAACISVLHEAWILACETRKCPWQFAVEIAELRALGLRHGDLRWLVVEGYAEHAEERTELLDRQRVFLTVENLAFGPGACFVLTARGAQLACALATAHGQAPRAERFVAASGFVQPRWDGDRRELTWDDRLVKKFRLPAENQQRILAAFEEDGWPVRIDDPLSRAHQIDPKARLHESIKALNRNQNLPLLRFSGDGTGQGVIWGVCSPEHHTDLPRNHPR